MWHKRRTLSSSILRSCLFVMQGIELAAAAPTSGTRQTELTIKRLVQTVAWENSRHFTTPTLVSPRNDAWWTSKEIPYWWRVTTQIWVMLLIGWSKFPTRLNQSEALPRSGKWHLISIKLLRSFLRRHFAGKPVTAPRNVVCFVRLLNLQRSSRNLVQCHFKTFSPR